MALRGSHILGSAVSKAAEATVVIEKDIVYECQCALVCRVSRLLAQIKNRLLKLLVHVVAVAFEVASSVSIAPDTLEYAALAGVLVVATSKVSTYIHGRLETYSS